MTRNHLAVLKLRVAKRGSKRGWATWTGQIPPALHERLAPLLNRFQMTDVVWRALEAYADTPSERRTKERRDTERRSA